MLRIPVIRWGKPYESLEHDKVVHFETGEPIAEIGQTNGALIARDMRQAQKARDALRKIPVSELIARCKKAGQLYTSATLPMGNGTQTPDEFVHAQSASTGEEFDGLHKLLPARFKLKLGSYFVPIKRYRLRNG